MPIDPQATALIVVDILQGADGDTVYAPSVSESDAAYRAKASQAVEAARAAGVPVVFACDAHFPQVDHELKLWGDHGIAGQPGSEPAAFLNPGPSDYVIRKRRYDAFHETSLDTLLRELGVRQVVLIGEDTNICVRHTACGAYYRCYDVIVATDATRTFLYGTQEEGEECLRRLYDARLLTTDELCDELAGA